MKVAGLAILGLGVFIGVVVILSLLFKPQRVPARWIEDDDGVQPDPYLMTFIFTDRGSNA
jgi:hypothetical protein